MKDDQRKWRGQPWARQVGETAKQWGAFETMFISRGEFGRPSARARVCSQTSRTQTAFRSAFVRSRDAGAQAARALRERFVAPGRLLLHVIFASVPPEVLADRQSRPTDRGTRS